MSAFSRRRKVGEFSNFPRQSISEQIWIAIKNKCSRKKRREKAAMVAELIEVEMRRQQEEFILGKRLQRKKEFDELKRMARLYEQQETMEVQEIEEIIEHMKFTVDGMIVVARIEAEDREEIRVVKEERRKELLYNDAVIASLKWDVGRNATFKEFERFQREIELDESNNRQELQKATDLVDTDTQDVILSDVKSLWVEEGQEQDGSLEDLKYLFIKEEIEIQVQKLVGLFDSDAVRSFFGDLIADTPLRAVTADIEAASDEAVAMVDNAKFIENSPTSEPDGASVISLVDIPYCLPRDVLPSVSVPLPLDTRVNRIPHRRLQLLFPLEIESTRMPLEIESHPSETSGVESGIPSEGSPEVLGILDMQGFHLEFEEQDLGEVALEKFVEKVEDFISVLDSEFFALSSTAAPTH